ncbi:MAG: acrC, partial [Armatimonadetes bacterium]|nr:acrC [Armatimonadota bacterium]
MSAVESDRERQMREAQELLGDERTRSFAKGLFFGRFDPDLAFPYPVLPVAEQAHLDEYLDRVREFLRTQVDPYTIDRESRIPQSV